MIAVFYLLVCREMRLACRRGSELFAIPVFFILATILFPLALGPEQDRLAELAGGIVWALAMLASLVPTNGALREDYEDGSLALLIGSGVPIGAVIFAKVASHIVLVGGTILLIAPLLALALGISGHVIPVLLASLALGIPSLGLTAMAGSCLTLGAAAGRGGMVAVLLTMPLCLPVLIFGAGAVRLGVEGMDYGTALQFLAGILLFEAGLAPWLMISALRASMQE